MSRQNEPVTVSVRNLGGIDSRELTFEPGVTVLTGRNATNRTSFLRALSAALGGSDGALKSDADRGSVELTLDGETYTRRLERQGETVTTAGDPFTDDETVVDLFSCLLATNPARRAVERGDSDALREIVMRPVDTEEIRTEIRRHQREVRTISDRIDELERELDRLPELERRLDERRDDRESVESELETVRETVEAFEADVDAAAEAEAVVEDLKETREEYERVREQLQTQRNALDSLADERESIEAELAESTAPKSELEDAEAELERLQRRQRELENTINNLVSIVEFNEGLVDEAAGDLPTTDGLVADSDRDASDEGSVREESDGDRTDSRGSAVGEETDSRDAVLDELDPASQTVECWTCGTNVERDAISDRLDDLRDVVDEKRRRRNELRTEISEHRETVSALREDVRERESLAAELDDVDDEVTRRESRVEDLESRASDLRAEIDSLEDAATDSESLRDSELLERYQRLSELEYERGQIDEQIDSLEAEIQSIEERRDERERLETERDDHRNELASLRSRIADLERAAVETFNDHMETLLEVLDYENVERVWIERKTGADADDVAPESSFDLHVVRSTPDGAVYEDTVVHLSESEREIIGLVVALAGYLVHDVREDAPFVLLDSLEAIDADRIAALVDYFADHAPYLVVALLPEDAQALSGEHARIVMDEAAV